MFILIIAIHELLSSFSHCIHLLLPLTPAYLLPCLFFLLWPFWGNSNSHDTTSSLHHPSLYILMNTFHTHSLLSAPHFCDLLLILPVSMDHSTAGLSCLCTLKWLQLALYMAWLSGLMYILLVPCKYN